MKLISLYIENFGGLTQYELEFDAGLTTIKQPNGFGKTTLAEFIRAMLYGFPRKSKTLEKSKRQKYAPWNGGLYGGNLVFEHEGLRYRVERTFGTVPKGDTFALIDLQTNRKTNRFSEEIGIELFGLDSDSFERSAYLPQMREEGALSTATIQAKLSDLVEDSSDVGNFEKAMAALRAKRSSLIPYRGNGGAVAEASSMVSQLQMQLDRVLIQSAQLEAAQKNADQCEIKIEQLQAALEKLRQGLAAASEMAAVVSLKQQYGQLLEQHRQALQRVKYFQEQYPKGMPDEETFSAAEAVADRWAVLAAQNITTQADLQVQSMLREYAQMEGQLPTAQQIDDCRRKCEAYEALQVEIGSLQRSMAELMQAERLRLTADQNALPKGLSISAILAWLIGAAGVLSGAVLMVMQEFLCGAIGLSIGAAAVVIGIILLLSRKSMRRTQEEALLAQRKELDEKIGAVQQKINGLHEIGEQHRRAIGQYLSAYFGQVEPQYFRACLTQLEHKVQLYSQAKQHTAETDKCRNNLEKLFGQYGIAMEPDVRAQLRRLREDEREQRIATMQERTFAQQAAQFRAEHSEALLADTSQTADSQQLKQEEMRVRSALTDLTGQLLQTRQRIRELQAQTEQIPQLQEELECWQTKKTEAREKARILDETMDFLQQAKDCLSVSYLETIRTRFGHYLSMLEGGADERYLIDTDLQVQLERLGQARELAYFSAGQADLVMLCMRLALVDALFKGQETFVVLDDPFVNLDDDHTSQMLKLLRTLAEKRQIIYLTCHSSRTA